MFLSSRCVRSGWVALILLLLVSACGKSTSPPTAPAPPPKPVVGKPAPEFTLQDITGKTWRLSELKGQLVFLNFWATWCPPCREELPSMVSLNQRLQGEKFKMITVLYNDDPKKAEGLFKANGYSLPILLDPDGRTYAAYGLTGVPETFIIDKDGILREWIIGPALWTSGNAINMLSQHLPKGGRTP